jgi:hypothetical protein
MLVASLVTQLNLLLCPFVMLDGLAVNERIVGFVAARPTPLSTAQASKVSRIKKALPQHIATVLRSTASNCWSTAPPIFIFHLGSTHDPSVSQDNSTSNGSLNQPQNNPTFAHFYIALTDLNFSA